MENNYQHLRAVLKDGKLLIEANLEPKPNDESMFYKRKSEGENWGHFLLREWNSKHEYFPLRHKNDIDFIRNKFLDEALINGISLKIESVVIIEGMANFIEANDRPHEIAMNRLVGWFRDRVEIKDHEVQYLKFVMSEYSIINFVKKD
jgi:hypothetical protein